MSACMASPIKLAHALNRKKGEEPPKTCLAAEELGDGILVPSRLYMYMNKDDGEFYRYMRCTALLAAENDC